MIKKSLLKIVFLILIIGLNWAGLLAISKTSAFFDDNGISSGNAFQSGTLDFSLSAPKNFSPDLRPSQTTSSRTIGVSKDGSLGFQYRVRVENATGDLCSHLELKDNSAGSSFQPLSGFSSTTTTFFNKSNWIFTANSPNPDESLQGKICNFNLVFEGWQENLSDNTQGFTDTETINNIVKMGYWDPPVVLNEFLPNAAGDYPEFIELYNKTTSPIDLAGFYIKADGNIIPINASTTSQYSEGSTVIPANGWLVVTTGGNILDDTSGTITLYNPNDVIVDSYTYGNPDHNVNNTPGSANNSSSGTVPPDKSYARIPDGTDNWVDPYPTPGAPNRLSEEEKIEFGAEMLPAEERISASDVKDSGGIADSSKVSIGDATPPEDGVTIFRSSEGRIDDSRVDDAIGNVTPPEDGVVLSFSEVGQNKVGQNRVGQDEIGQLKIPEEQGNPEKLPDDSEAEGRSTPGKITDDSGQLFNRIDAGEAVISGVNINSIATTTPSEDGIVVGDK